MNAWCSGGFCVALSSALQWLPGLRPGSKAQHRNACTTGHTLSACKPWPHQPSTRADICMLIPLLHQPSTRADICMPIDIPLLDAHQHSHAADFASNCGPTSIFSPHACMHDTSLSKRYRITTYSTSTTIGHCYTARTIWPFGLADTPIALFSHFRRCHANNQAPCGNCTTATAPWPARAK